jgi:uncharacterized protein (DUF362 family)
MKYNRRDFLKASAVLGAASTVFKPVRVWAKKDDGKLLRTVVQVKGTDTEKMVRKAFGSLGGLGRFIQSGMWVVLKPNASFANEASWGNNTNPKVLRQVAKLCREAGARRVTVVDYPLLRGAEALQMNGIAEAIADLKGVDLKVLGKKEHFRKVTVPGGKTLTQTQVAREVLDADFMINIPVAKAHDAVAASIGLKNLMGVIWDRTVFHTGMEINLGIADLARAVRPGLTLVDLTRVMVTNGPKGPGEVATPEMVVAGVDPVAVDSYCLRQVRFNRRKFRPRQLRYLVEANQAGLGRIDLGELNILKEDA